MTTPRLRRDRSAPVAGALLCLAALSGAACVTGSDVEQLHRHIGDVEKKVTTLAAQTSSKEEVARLNENLQKQVATLLRSNADLGTRFDELTRELQSLAGKLEDANRRLAQVSQQIAEAQVQIRRSGAGSGSVPEEGALPSSGEPAGGSGVTAPPPAASAGGRAPSPADIYNQALADYQRGQFDLARQGFQEYLDTYPKTDLSDDALYWMSECFAAQKKWRETIATLDRLFRFYPQSDKAALSHLKKGLAHLELGEKAQAIVQLQFVVNEYPASDEAKSARQRLRALGAEPR